MSILDKDGDVLTDQKKIVNCSNQYIANISPNIENKMRGTEPSYTNNLKNIKINYSFLL